MSPGPSSDPSSPFEDYLRDPTPELDIDPYPYWDYPRYRIPGSRFAFFNPCQPKIIRKGLYRHIEIPCTHNRCWRHFDALAKEYVHIETRAPSTSTHVQTPEHKPLTLAEAKQAYYEFISRGYPSIVDNYLADSDDPLPLHAVLINFRAYYACGQKRKLEDQQEGSRKRRCI